MRSVEELTEGQLRLLEVDQRIQLPRNSLTRILVTSADVIHSWAVPSLGLKIDACPGRLNQIWALPLRAGVFYGQCSELCGVNHGFMPIVVEVVPRVQYHLEYLFLRPGRSSYTVKVDPVFVDKLWAVFNGRSPEVDLAFVDKPQTASNGGSRILLCESTPVEPQQPSTPLSESKEATSPQAGDDRPAVCEPPSAEPQQRTSPPLEEDKKELNQLELLRIFVEYLINLKAYDGRCRSEIPRALLEPISELLYS